MSPAPDPADKLDAAADGAFSGKPTTHNHRAGYGNTLYWALRMGRKGGTLHAGEGLVLIKHFEELVQDAWMEGRMTDVTWENSETFRKLEQKF